MSHAVGIQLRSVPGSDIPFLEIKGNISPREAKAILGSLSKKPGYYFEPSTQIFTPIDGVNLVPSSQSNPEINVPSYFLTQLVTLLCKAAHRSGTSFTLAFPYENINQLTYGFYPPAQAFLDGLGVLKGIGAYVLKDKKINILDRQRLSEADLEALQDLSQKKVRKGSVLIQATSDTPSSGPALPTGTSTYLSRRPGEPSDAPPPYVENAADDLHNDPPPPGYR